MKHLIYIFIWFTFLQASALSLKASSLEEKKQIFRITVLNTGGEPQQGIILRVVGYSNEYVSDEQGLIEFEQSVDKNYARTANFYLPTDKNKSLKSLRLDEAAQDTIIRIDRPEDLVKFKQSGKTFQVKGILKEGGRPVPHAEISVQGTGRHSFSDKNGEFTIEADYSHLIMVRAESMENKYLDSEAFLQQPDHPLEIRMVKKGADRVYHVVEKMPEYPGGMKAFFNYIKRKARTSELAEKTQKEGAVMIQFVVEKDGSITSPSIVRGLDARLDTAALDAIMVMPDWIPAQDHGISVRCKYSVPIPFKRPQPVKPAPVAPKAPQQSTSVKDSMLVQPVPTDSLKQDTTLQVMPKTPVDSLLTDSLKKDTTLVVPTDSLLLKQAISSETPSEAVEMKPKKRNFLVRFFRWLFGIKDKETTEKEEKEPKEAQETLEPEPAPPITEEK
ncbi:MAG TPA: TonB family protein [Bacteroides mediterraneensis]|uniref:TonB family protein n=1 Tax=Bacteroides mediterraneensis TaxID=1841856 RepID=UPI00262A22A1|nr:TonB family protein [Bacteroides mediterraneensis]HJH65593.1 TonB family protein [Bacteroides mediterraneensis]